MCIRDRGYDFGPSRDTPVVITKQIYVVSFRAVSILSVTPTGSIKILGSAEGKGTINPDRGDTSKIYFKGNAAGRFELRIFTTAGILIWNDSKDGVQEGMFEWVPHDIASGIYIAQVQGPGINSRGKIAIVR